MIIFPCNPHKHIRSVTLLNTSLKRAPSSSSREPISLPSRHPEHISIFIVQPKQIRPDGASQRTSHVFANVFLGPCKSGPETEAHHYRLVQQNVCYMTWWHPTLIVSQKTQSWQG